jgi:hypothetical protein
MKITIKKEESKVRKLTLRDVKSGEVFINFDNCICWKVDGVLILTLGCDSQGFPMAFVAIDKYTDPNSSIEKILGTVEEIIVRPK